MTHIESEGDAEMIEQPNIKGIIENRIRRADEQSPATYGVGRYRGRSCCASTDGDVHDRSCETDEALASWAPRSSRPEPQPAAEIDGFRVGDHVRVHSGHVGPGRASDIWRIRSLYNVPGREPFAGLMLVGRAGGLPIGETGTAIRLSLLQHVGEQTRRFTVDLDAFARSQREAGMQQALRMVASLAPHETLAAQAAMRLGVEL